MKNYNLSYEAKDDLIRIYNYGQKKFGSRQAEKYFNNFFNQFQIIAERPFSFESIDSIKRGYRRCVCGVDTIYFRIENNTVEIMTIVGRQDISDKLNVDL